MRRPLAQLLALGLGGVDALLHALLGAMQRLLRRGGFARLVGRQARHMGQGVLGLLNLAANGLGGRCQDALREWGWTGGGNRDSK